MTAPKKRAVRSPSGDRTYTTADAFEAARPGDQWNCGNGHLRAQTALTLIEKAGVRDVEAMQWLDDAAYEAGPDFCRDLLNSRMPF